MNSRRQCIEIVLSRCVVKQFLLTTLSCGVGAHAGDVRTEFENATLMDEERAERLVNRYPAVWQAVEEDIQKFISWIERSAEELAE